MLLPKRQKGLFYVVLIACLILITGNTSLKDSLPPALQKILYTDTQHEDAGVKGTNTPPLNMPKQAVRVIRVIDGDTIVLEGGIKLRYIGMNSPESVDPRRPVQCYAKEATRRNEDLVLGKFVIIEKDVSETDVFGRLLRYVYLPAENGEVTNGMVNEILVREGYAYASAYPPDIRYQETLRNAENEARLAMRGLWNLCNAIPAQ